jgi:hypothetical protein
VIVEVFPYIKAALDDETLHDKALGYYIDALPGLMSEMKKRTGLRGSDAGRCTHELWAMIRDVVDLPQDPIGRLTRLDLGSLYGAHMAALFKAGFERTRSRRLLPGRQMPRRLAVRERARRARIRGPRV